MNQCKPGETCGPSRKRAVRWNVVPLCCDMSPAENAQTYTITSHLLCFARPRRVKRQTRSSRSSSRT